MHYFSRNPMHNAKITIRGGDNLKNQRMALSVLDQLETLKSIPMTTDKDSY